MFEGILNERNENQRGYLLRTVGSNLQFRMEMHMGSQSDAHQLNVAADKLYLLGQRYSVLLVVVEHMAEQATKLLYRLLSLVGIEGYQGVDVVQRVEQEVGD